MEGRGVFLFNLKCFEDWVDNGCIFWQHRGVERGNSLNTLIGVVEILASDASLIAAPLGGYHQVSMERK